MKKLEMLYINYVLTQLDIFVDIQVIVLYVFTLQKELRIQQNRNKQLLVKELLYLIILQSKNINNKNKFKKIKKNKKNNKIYLMMEQKYLMIKMYKYKIIMKLLKKTKKYQKKNNKNNKQFNKNKLIINNKNKNKSMNKN